MIRGSKWVKIAVAIVALAGVAPAQQVEAPAAFKPALPFGVGERLVYSLSGRTLVGVPVGGGSGILEVLPMEIVRGHPALHIRFAVKASAFFLFHLNDQYDSWLDPAALVSLRFWENIKNPGYSANRKFEIFPELRQFRQDANPVQPSAEGPLDEAAFVYFIRTIPLAVGETYSFSRYFKVDRNPVTVHVERREHIKVAGRDWDAIVVQPTILTSGRTLFSKDSHAEIWLSNDPDHIILKLESHFEAKSSLSLSLTSFTPGKPTPRQ